MKLKKSLYDFTIEELNLILKKVNCPYWSRISTILISQNFYN